MWRVSARPVRGAAVVGESDGGRLWDGLCFGCEQVTALRTRRAARPHSALSTTSVELLGSPSLAPLLCHVTVREVHVVSHSAHP